MNISTFSLSLFPKEVFQIHSSQYQSPEMIPDGPVLVIGGGNSGTQIATELAENREVTIAISHPFKFLPLNIMGKSIFYWLEKIGLLYAGTDTRRGSWFRKQSDPIFGLELSEFWLSE
ncbi:cation diffusion facilitator CzcD-associated flavoprotein CzcO [Lysinibacillus sp. RC79]